MASLTERVASATSSMTDLSLKEMQSNTAFLRTRPGEGFDKRGKSGKQVMLKSNYFKVNQLPNFIFTQYDIKFEPEIDNQKVRNYLISTKKDILGGFIYDNNNIFLTKELQEKTLEFQVGPTKKDEYFKMTLKKTRTVSVNDRDGDHLLNVILRKAMSELKLEQIRRNLFDPENKVILKDYAIELWPGYVTAIREHEAGVLMCCEISHKVLRQDTIYDIFRKIKEESRGGEDFKDKFKREVCGMIVMTKYNNKTYRVDDVKFDETPKLTFKDRDGSDKSLIDYYNQRYNVQIRDLHQPLLVSNPTFKDIRGSHQKGEPRTMEIRLIPELCFATGLSDSMRSNFQLMKAMSEYTRMNPTKRIERLMNFNNRLLTTPKSAEKFQSYDLQLESKLIQFNGRQLDQEEMIFGNGKKVTNDEVNVDWTNPMKVNEMFANVDLERWAIIYPKRASSDTTQFLRMLEDVARGMRYKMSQPKQIEIPDDRIATYAKNLEEIILKDPKFIMVIVPNSAADRYASIKKATCIGNSIPTQVVVQKTMQPKKGNMGSVKSIATKVLIQCNVKLGGAAWSVKMPVKGLMTIGFDVTHDASKKDSSYGTFIATMDLQKNVKFFSAVAQHKRGEELSGFIGNLLRKAIQTYFQLHGVLPEKFLFYRDGVGQGDIQTVLHYEVAKIKQIIQEMYKEANTEGDPKFTFIVVSKRINTRFFARIDGRTDNPRSGTVVDDVVTLKERYDFFLISQSVRQGTVSPTEYNIIHDNLGLPPDRLQLLTYKMCHLYYNWSGTTRVPAVLQYAQKLGVLVGQHLHQTPNINLSNTLYFL